MINNSGRPLPTSGLKVPFALPFVYAASREPMCSSPSLCTSLATSYSKYISRASPLSLAFQRRASVLFRDLQRSIRMRLSRDAISSFVDLPLMTFHASVTFFLCCRRRKDNRIRNAFFTIYIIVSFADLTTMSVVRLWPTRCASLFYISVHCAYQRDERRSLYGGVSRLSMVSEGANRTAIL